MKKLIEATEILSTDYGYSLFQDCIENLKKLGDKYKIDEEDFVFGGWFEATTLQGQVGLGVENGEFRQSIAFNKNLLRAGLEDILVNTIYHELLHIITNKELIKLGYIKVSEDGEKPEVVNKSLFNNLQEQGGHAWLWLEMADEVNKKFNLELPITAHCTDDEVKRVLVANDDQEVQLEIYCTECDNSTKYISLNPHEIPIHFLAALFQSTENDTENDFCGKCHGTMRMKIYNKDFEDWLRAKASDILLAMMLKSLLGGN